MWMKKKNNNKGYCLNIHTHKRITVGHGNGPVQFADIRDVTRGGRLVCKITRCNFRICTEIIQQPTLWPQVLLFNHLPYVYVCRVLYNIGTLKATMYHNYQEMTSALSVMTKPKYRRLWIRRWICGQQDIAITASDRITAFCQHLSSHCVKDIMHFRITS